LRRGVPAVAQASGKWQNASTKGLQPLLQGCFSGNLPKWQKNRNFKKKFLEKCLEI
jgi:hypothetical protein